MKRNGPFLLVLLVVSFGNVRSSEPEENPVSIKEARQLLLDGGLRTRVLVEGDTRSVTFLTSSFHRKNLPVLFTYILVDPTGEIEILANPCIPPIRGGHIRALISPTTTMDSSGKEPGLPAFEIERVLDTAN